MKPNQPSTSPQTNGKPRHGRDGEPLPEILPPQRPAPVDVSDFAEAVVRTARDPLLILNAKLEVEIANDAFYSTFKVDRQESVGRSVFNLDHHHWDIPKLRELLEDILPRHSFFNDFEVTHRFEHIGTRTMLLNARTLKDSAGAGQRVLLGIQDITELLHFQAQMRRSELRFRRLFETSQDGILLVDPDSHRIIDANPTISDLLGYSRPGLIGKDLSAAGFFTNANELSKTFEELKATGYSRTNPLEVQTSVGEIRLVDLVSACYREGTDQIIQFSFRDVTLRMRIETELKEKARLLDLSNDAVIVCDIASAITLWNKGAEKLFGWPAAEAMGKHLHTLLKTDLFQPFEAIFRELQAHGQYSGEMAMIARDGRRVPSHCRWVLDRSTNSILGSYTDISSAKQIENDLQKSELRYKTLFESIDEGFCVIEMIFDETGHAADYRFVETNPSFEKHTGFNGLGKRMREIEPHHEDYWFHTFGEVARTHEPIRFVYEAEKLNRWFDVFAFPAAESGENRQVAILFKNITDHMKAQAVLETTRLRLADRAIQLEAAVASRTAEVTAAYQQLEDFVYSIAHDLRAPLRAMEGYSTLLIEEAKTSLSDSCQLFASRIGVSARFMDALLRDLIAFSGIAKQNIDLTPIDLHQAVRLAISCLEIEIDQKGARIRIDGKWPHVLAHEPTIGPVLLHLLQNALKFVGPGVIPLIRIWPEVQDNAVRVWIEDNGIGIAPDHQDQAFRMFVRLNGESYSGTGIGLAIVKKGIARMSGRSGVVSLPGEGSRFWFELPIATPALAFASPPTAIELINL